MMKFIEIFARAEAAHLRAQSLNKVLKPFMWFQTNSYILSEEEFGILWKLLQQVFAETYGSCQRFQEPGESQLEIFDFRCTNDEAGQFIHCVEERFNKLKAFL